MRGPSRWSAARGRLIVSCQAAEGEAFYGPGLMARFARAAVAGGAGGIRAHGAADVSEIRAATVVPILGIHKERVGDGKILITPSFESAEALAAAGADAIALDCTARGIRYGALERLKRVRRELGLPVLADIATMEEAEAAAAAGADFVLSTMRGYTEETHALAGVFEPEFIAQLARRLSVPVIAEGRIADPREARAAMEAGAWAVVVGSAITRPHEITRRYADAVAAAGHPEWTAAIDLGATNVKYGLVSRVGTLEAAGVAPTVKEGPEALVGQLRRILRQMLGAVDKSIEAVAVATAGWVDTGAGTILHATGNLRDWTGARVREALALETDLPVFVENDAICAAAGEWAFGAARGARNALCVTLGTGIGAGAIVEGRLLRGAHGLALMLGHLPVAGAEAECNCGLMGCLEAEIRFRQAPRQYAALLAEGLMPAVHLLDPEVIVLAGGIAAANPELGRMVEEQLAGRVLAWDKRRLAIRHSSAGHFAGVKGAAAAAALALHR